MWVIRIAFSYWTLDIPEGPSIYAFLYGIWRYDIRQLYDINILVCEKYLSIPVISHQIKVLIWSRQRYMGHRDRELCEWRRVERGETNAGFSQMFTIFDV